MPFIIVPQLLQKKVKVKSECQQMLPRVHTIIVGLQEGKKSHYSHIYLPINMIKVISPRALGDDAPNSCYLHWLQVTQ